MNIFLSNNSLIKLFLTNRLGLGMLFFYLTLHSNVTLKVLILVFSVLAYWFVINFLYIEYCEFFFPLVKIDFWIDVKLSCMV